MPKPFTISLLLLSSATFSMMVLLLDQSVTKYSIVIMISSVPFHLVEGSVPKGESEGVFGENIS